MAKRSKDLFDDSVMTFGEHLEALRIHLGKALIGLVIAMAFCLWKGDVVVHLVRRPLEASLQKYNNKVKLDDDLKNAPTFFESLKSTLGYGEPEVRPEEKDLGKNESLESADSLTVEIAAEQLVGALDRAAGKAETEVPAELQGKQVPLTLKNPLFAELRSLIKQSNQPVTLNVQEGFMTYLKLSAVAGLLLSSPWIFYQIWMFVAAGLYTHERKYVYYYGGLSLVLFLAGILFCYYLVFPFVLRFLISFNSELDLTLQPRLSEWITFAIILPLMFGISFQLPLVMVFLERLQILDTDAYWQHWRFAVLAIAFISMVLTPADPVSMILMMTPLTGLYFLGILLCRYSPARQIAAEA